MIFLISAPVGFEWLLILFPMVLVITVLYLTYRAGFNNGKREGERLQLQKQVDANRA